MYGRAVSKCTLEGKGDIGHWLVSSGHAIAYRCMPLLCDLHVCGRGRLLG